MAFLAPLFLLGAAGIALPVIFHLLRRRPRERTPFSSLMFLEPTPPRVSKRSRLENLWLLLLRCAVIGLLALGFARPFLPQQTATSLAAAARQPRRTVLLVDTSASMRREDLWAQARARAAALLREAAPGDEWALLTFDRQPRTLLSFEQWREAGPGSRSAAALQRLEAASPGWAGTRLGPALLHAAELLEAPGAGDQGPREIIVLTDAQEGTRMDGLQGHPWPRGLAVRIEALKVRQGANASVQWLAGDEEAAAPEGPRLRVANSPENRTEHLTLQWDGAPAGTTLALNLPAGQSRVVRASAPPSDGARMVLTGDDTPFDNTLFILAPQPQPVPVLYLGNDANEDPAGSFYYLLRAFRKTPARQVDLRAVRGHAPAPASQFREAQLAVLGEGIDESALDGLRQFVREGKTLLAPLGSPAAAALLGRLIESTQFTAQEAALRDYAMLGEIDFQHPILEPFADPRYSDFTKIHFWKYRRVDPAQLPGSRVLARFDNRDPALLEVPFGQGRVLILASTWRPADSQLALSTKFVPLLLSLLDQSSQLPPRKAQYFAGDDIPLPPGRGPFTVRTPGGREVAAEPGSVFHDTAEPGIYLVSPIGLRLAVNLSPEESQLAPLAPDRLAGLGLPLAPAGISAGAPAIGAGKDPARAQAQELENRQKLWRWGVAAALAVLLVETLLAARLSRHHAQPSTGT